MRVRLSEEKNFFVHENIEKVGSSDKYFTLVRRLDASFQKVKVLDKVLFPIFLAKDLKPSKIMYFSPVF